MLLIALVLWLAGAADPTTPKPLIDNPRVTVWDVPSAAALPGDPARDRVVISLEPEAVAGRVLFRPRGAARSAQSTAGATRLVVIELKDTPVPPLKNASGYPNAFPREGSKKIVDNERVLVWDFSWTSGQPTRMHFHDKDVVVVYLQTGDLKSTTPAGDVVVNHYAAGTIKFNPRDRVHTELLVAGAQRAIITELK